MKKVHDAEKELDKAQRRLKAASKSSKKKSRFESVNHRIFLIDLLEKRSVKRGSRLDDTAPEKKFIFLFFLIDVLENDQLKGSPYE